MKKALKALIAFIGINIIIVCFACGAQKTTAADEVQVVAKQPYRLKSVLDYSAKDYRVYCDTVMNGFEQLLNEYRIPEEFLPARFYRVISTDSKTLYVEFESKMNFEMLKTWCYDLSKRLSEDPPLYDTNNREKRMSVQFGNIKKLSDSTRAFYGFCSPYPSISISDYDSNGVFTVILYQDILFRPGTVIGQGPGPLFIYVPDEQGGCREILIAHPTGIDGGLIPDYRISEYFNYMHKKTNKLYSNIEGESARAGLQYCSRDIACAECCVSDTFLFDFNAIKIQDDKDVRDFYMPCLVKTLFLSCKVLIVKFSVKDSVVYVPASSK